MSLLTVVIPTFNRADVLRATLDCLNQQTLPPEALELLVCDDGSTDATASVVHDFATAGRVAVRYLQHENRGPGFTQNRGIREARSPRVLILADDMHASPGLVEAHLRLHDEHADPRVVVMGRIVQSPRLVPSVFHRHWDPFRTEVRERGQVLPPTAFWACNVSFDRGFMLEHGMFLERRGAAAEDLELGWRLHGHGMRLLACPDAVTEHEHPTDVDSMVRRARECGRQFDLVSDHVRDPAFYRMMEIVTWRTLPCFFKHASSRDGGLAPAPSPTRLVVRHALRNALFNRLTVPRLILPLIRAAETNPHLARRVSNRLLRCVEAYYFSAGLREMRRRRRHEDNSVLPLMV